ncbi:MAG TPA: hypothetical protein PK683_11905, partial [Leptospiraceae bacterium]|nr:hypothetical protein [Leptospiraceae bacterium]
MKSYRFGLLLVLIFLQCTTTVKIPVMNKSPQGFMEFMRGGRDIGMYVYKKDNADLPSGGEADWKTVVHG